jgi:hypothetical protein
MEMRHMERLRLAIDIDDTIIHHPAIRSMQPADIGPYFDRVDFYDDLTMSTLNVAILAMLQAKFDIYFVTKCFLSHLDSKKNFIDRSMKTRYRLKGDDDPWAIPYTFVDFGIDYESSYDKSNGIVPGHDTGKGTLAWADYFVDDSKKNLLASSVENLYLIKYDCPSSGHWNDGDDGRDFHVVRDMSSMYQHICT